MVEKNKVKLTICGTDYNVLSDDSEQYMTEIGKQVDKRIYETLNGNSRLSTTMAAILVSLEFCDLARKYKCKLEALKNKHSKEFQGGLLEKTAFDNATFQIENLKREIDGLKTKISLVSRENNTLIQRISEQELEIQSFEKQTAKEAEKQEPVCGDDILNFFDFQQITNKQE